MHEHILNKFIKSKSSIYLRTNALGKGISFNFFIPSPQLWAKPQKSLCALALAGGQSMRQKMLITQRGEDHVKTTTLSFRKKTIQFTDNKERNLWRGNIAEIRKRICLFCFFLKGYKLTFWVFNKYWLYIKPILCKISFQAEANKEQTNAENSETSNKHGTSFYCHRKNAPVPDFEIQSGNSFLALTSDETK